MGNIRLKEDAGKIRKRRMESVEYKKLLITGFEPFGGETLNASWEAVSRLPEEIAHYQLEKLQIPTVFGNAADKVLEAAHIFEPDAILCVGQAGGRTEITPEVIGINLRESRIADNAGNQPMNVPVLEGGAAAYFSTAPVREMVREIKKAGIPASLSYTAGTFVCNDLLYTLLHHYHDTRTLVGFIHVPFLLEQAREKRFCLPLEDIVTALAAAICAMP